METRGGEGGEDRANSVSQVEGSVRFIGFGRRRNDSGFQAHSVVTGVPCSRLNSRPLELWAHLHPAGSGPGHTGMLHEQGSATDFTPEEVKFALPLVNAVG